MTTPSISTLLSFANLQMAAEATDLPRVISGEATLEQALIRGNGRSSRFPDTVAAQFAPQWQVVAHRSSTDTGFDGTLFKYGGATDEGRGLVQGQYVLSFRSLEFIDAYVRAGNTTSARRCLTSRTVR